MYAITNKESKRSENCDELHEDMIPICFGHHL